MTAFAIRIGFQRIDIVLDHPQKVYYSGHQVSGSVHVELKELEKSELALGKIHNLIYI